MNYDSWKTASPDDIDPVDEVEEEAEIYDVTVWDTVEGDVVRRIRRATEEQLAEVEAEYSDDPRYEIQIDDAA